MSHFTNIAAWVLVAVWSVRPLTILVRLVSKNSGNPTNPTQLAR